MPNEDMAATTIGTATFAQMQEPQTLTYYSGDTRCPPTPAADPDADDAQSPPIINPSTMDTICQKFNQAFCRGGGSPGGGPDPPSR